MIFQVYIIGPTFCHSRWYSRGGILVGGILVGGILVGGMQHQESRPIFCHFWWYSRGWYSRVAPHVGEWIETRTNPQPLCDRNVAPHVGAWIE